MRNYRNCRLLIPVLLRKNTIGRANPAVEKSSRKRSAERIIHPIFLKTDGRLWLYLQAIAGAYVKLEASAGRRISEVPGRCRQTG
jgi:hypothetical protein